ncbi:MAG: hypothetical protein IIB17_12180, partial [Chloroflexi bacterium]|nr:hypothetical protein [Chloroflexota bacterium]
MASISKWNDSTDAIASADISNMDCADTSPSGVVEESETCLGSAVGAGVAVGSGVARVAAAFGMKVLFSDLREIPETERHGAESVPVGDLFALSDVVSLHVDGRESNRKFVRESLLEHMKSNAMLINTSRGFVVDNESLADKLGKNPEMLALL